MTSLQIEPEINYPNISPLKQFHIFQGSKVTCGFSFSHLLTKICFDEKR